MAPRVGFSNLYHNWVYTGGAFQLGFNLRWGAVQMHTRTNRLQHLWMPPEQHYSTLFWHLPLRTGDERAGRVNEFYREWIRHPDYGPYWERLGNVEKDYAEIDVPAYGFGGWYDVFLQGTLNNFMGVRAKGRTERARRQKVLIGPWIHSLGERGTQSRTGDVDFGAASLIDLRREELRWFDYWLRGVDDGIMSEPPVKVFVMGANALAHRGGLAHPRDALRPPLLPLRRPGEHALGRRRPRPAGARRGAARPVRLRPGRPRADARREHLLRRGHHAHLDGPARPANRRVAPRRPRVLDAAARGRRRGDRTDQGRAVGGVVGAGHGLHGEARRRLPVGVRDERRAGDPARAVPGLVRAAEPLEPGRPYRFEIDCWSSSNLFRRGHRIRVEIASSNFPQFDRNPNTGRPFGEDTDLVRATQTVYHDAQHPSHIVLPIVD